VIGVGVRDHHQRQLANMQTSQATIDGQRIRSGVNQHGRPVAEVDRRGIALSDVTGNDEPSVRRPAWLRRPSHGKRQPNGESTDHSRSVGDPPQPEQEDGEANQ
jgi:hypothetical protein